MRYRPAACDRRAIRIMWMLIAAGAVCFCLTPVLPAGRAAFQLGAVALIGAGLYVGVRYVMTEFTYEIVPRDSALPSGEDAALAGGQISLHALPGSMLDFVVRKQNSRRGAVMDACMGLDDLRYFAPLPLDGGREREPYRLFPQIKVYEYTPSIRPQRQYMAVFVDSAQNAVGFVLEPDETFIAELSRIVRENGGGCGEEAEDEISVNEKE